MTPWMYKNKGTYLHPGGLAHSFIHAVGTGMSLVFMMIVLGYDPVKAHQAALLSATFDYTLHYHIDYAKVNVGRYFELLPTNSEWFWVLLGFDQLLHALTYFAIIGLFI